MAWSLDTCDSQNGRTCVVTGANAGIGFATAAVLSRLGARVILACRSLDKAKGAVERIKAVQPEALVRAQHLDLASLASIREFSAELCRDETGLDLLINNAGVMMPPLGRTTDGFETQFGTNFVGHFLLTGLLLPLLNRTPAARVVTLSSIAHWTAQIDFGNLNAERGYSRWTAYAQSKLANLLFAYELQRRLQTTGASTLSVAAHPGATASELSRHSALMTFTSRILTQPTANGALPSLRAALDADVKGGDFYGPSGFATLRGAPSKQRSSRRSHDLGIARNLWETGEKLTGAHYP
jgi:NAD(P)-dependent dehydrogenase (short-subunit alcohol dehydrogenase family)